DPAQQHADVRGPCHRAAEPVTTGGSVERHDGTADENHGGEAPPDRGKGPEHRARVVDDEQPARERETERHAHEQAERQNCPGGQFMLPSPAAALLAHLPAALMALTLGLAHRLRPEYGYGSVPECHTSGVGCPSNRGGYQACA